MYAGNWDGDIGGGVRISPDRLTIIAGPCMLESLELGLRVGTFLKELCDSLSLQFVFKSSYDKANRTSKGSVRGPGLESGLSWLETIRERLACPVLTDVHTPAQATNAGRVVDVVQIPAFLCEQRELLLAAARTGKAVQVKKGQHISPDQFVDVGHFLCAAGNPRVLLCERGTTFGYNNLVVDYRNLVEMRRGNHAVVFDATHAAQLPGAGGGQSSGLRHVIPALARAAVAVGVDALFLEVHEDPDQALSDAATQLPLDVARAVIEEASRLHAAKASFATR